MEDWGRWSVGNSCAVWVCGNELVKHEGDLCLNMVMNSFFCDQTVQLMLNDVCVSTIEVKTEMKSYEIILDKSLLHDQVNRIEFILSGEAVSPQEAGRSDDERKLGLGFISLVVKGKE